MLEHIYRFRNTRALLGEFHELQNQEIYFAPPAELNDPMEGYKDILWRGDAIVWTNLLKHYLLCLMQAVLTANIHGIGYQFAAHDVPVLLTEEELVPSSRALFQSICTKFFENHDLVELPVLLGAKTLPMRRNELFSLLFFVHFHALKVTCTVISPEKPLSAIDKFLRTQQDRPFRFQQFYDALKALDEKLSNSADITEEMNSKAASLVMQTIFLLDAAGHSKHHGPAWYIISSGFPELYIDEIERLLYRDSYIACFVAKPTHSAMWGTYGDGHRGVCLKFKTHIDGSGNPSLMLTRPVGQKSTAGATAVTQGDVLHQLHEVRYSGRYIEIDFFNSMGRLTGPQLASWFRGPNGEISPIGHDILNASESWRKQYWDNFYKALTAKLKDWRHENEYRVIFHSLIFDFSGKSSRKLRYLFDDLQGVIFGLKTSPEDKVEIFRIIKEKCEAAGRTDFEFYQAYYSRQTGEIETTRLDLLKFGKTKESDFA